MQVVLLNLMHSYLLICNGMQFRTILGLKYLFIRRLVGIGKTKLFEKNKLVDHIDELRVREEIEDRSQFTELTFSSFVFNN